MLEKNPLYEKNIINKIQLTDDFCHELLLSNSHDSLFKVPDLPAREIATLPPKMHPAKAGLSKKQGLARLLHDLATIELQAMELGIRTLIEFPNTDKIFKEQLVDIIFEEKNHLNLCLEAIDSLGFKWGDWPTHLTLWKATDFNDSLLDRMLIVHNFLEGSGLDASEKIQSRLFHCKHKPTLLAVKTIASEEVNHVLFGTCWYKTFCQNLKFDPNKDFHTRLFKLYQRLPRRLEKMNIKMRYKAGFSDENIESLIQLQSLQKKNL